MTTEREDWVEIRRHLGRVITEAFLWNLNHDEKTDVSIEQQALIEVNKAIECIDNKDQSGLRIVRGWFEELKANAEDRDGDIYD